MDERLPLGSLDASTLRMLLEKEREQRRALEQEVARLSMGLARQNERIIALERENAELREEIRLLRGLVDGLSEQNQLLRQQVAVLEAENARLKGEERPATRPPGAWPTDRTHHERSETDRKRRDRTHNHGRQRSSRVDERIEHAPEQCPRCGTALAGGWAHRRVQVIELPAPVQTQITEHVLMARRCPECRRRVVSPAPTLPGTRVGQCRFGPRLIAAIGHMVTVERLPGRQIVQRLEREYGLILSHGGMIGLVHRLARASRPAYEQLTADVRGSPMVQADETGWREDGVPGFIWTVTTPTQCLFHRDPHRSNEVIDRLLGADFGGTVVADFYAVYDHLPGLKQRCWAHLWRDIDALEREHPDDPELGAWVVGVRTIYTQATAGRPATECGTTPQAVRTRNQRARRYEQALLRLCPETMAGERAEATLAARIRRYSQELFTFVRDPAVPHTNNAAERSLRPLVIARKISGGTRSPAGSTTRMILASLAATAKLQGTDPAAAFERILRVP
jgi:transposase